MTTTPPRPLTLPAARRKIERLEAQIKAMQDFMQRDRKDEFMNIRRVADMQVRMSQAMHLLSGTDEP